MGIHFVQTDHRTAGPALHRHLDGRYSCRRISPQTHLVVTDDAPDRIAGGLTALAGPPRLIESSMGSCPDWRYLVATLVGSWAGAFEPPVARWVERHLPAAEPRSSSGPALFVAHWHSTWWQRRDRPDGFFRSRRDWIYPGFNTYVLRTRDRADAMLAGVRNKWRGARRGPKTREAVFIAELGGGYAAVLRDGLEEWLAEQLGPGDRAAAPSRGVRPSSRPVC